jgi:hypothetical protein
VISREISEASPEDVEGIVEIILKDSITRTLDLTLFDSLPSTAVRPAGLTNGNLTGAQSIGSTLLPADTRCSSHDGRGLFRGMGIALLPAHVV